MNSKKIAYILMTLSIMMIISGGVSSFFIGLKEDRVLTLKRIEDVKDEFEVFSANTSTSESYRDDLYNVVFSNTYIETMALYDAEVKNKLSNYENLVDQLTKNTNNMANLCDDMYYPDSEVNNRCLNYKSIYEQVVNYFVTDINVYNGNIDKYNQYQLSLNSGLQLEHYNTNKKFIDFNNDKKFDGKEE